MRGRDIKRARLKFRLSLKQLARLILSPHTGKHIHHMTLWRWENEEHAVPDDMGLKVAQVFYNLAREHVELMPCPHCDGTGLVQRPIFQEET